VSSDEWGGVSSFLVVDPSGLKLLSPDFTDASNPTKQQPPTRNELHTLPPKSQTHALHLRLKYVFQPPLQRQR